MAFTFYKQTDAMDCGITCLRMVAQYYGRDFSPLQLDLLNKINWKGSSSIHLSDVAEKIGFRTTILKVDFDKLLTDAPIPCIAKLNHNNFVVIYKIKKRRGLICVADPRQGLLAYAKQDFLKLSGNGANQIVILSLEPTPEFHEESTTPIFSMSEKARPKKGFRFLFRYLFKYKQLITQLIIGLLATSLLQLIFPFLTQSVVDVGIQNNDIGFIYLILLAQLMVFFGRTTIEVIRSYVLMYISSRVNISLISDFFMKLMKLPISFFDVKRTGDIMQRINDHYRIENFLVSTSLNVLFSSVNFIVFSVVLAFYNFQIFFAFLFGSALYFAWILVFLKRRANIYLMRFKQASQNQGKVYELIAGMQEIKLHNAEKQKRWQWEKIQARLFKINLKGLTLEQMQNAGSGLINELKNILITFLSAKLVIDGQITLGMMLSISYIIGQLNNPIMQLVGFVQSLQDVRLSLDRLSEIHNKKDEEHIQEKSITEIVVNASIEMKNISFKYAGSYDQMVLKKVNLTIPANKITAIVGSSGSGKTTLMKLLLKFYDPTEGEVKIGAQNLNGISPKAWRNACGAVMQDGYVFSDTIANNIALGAEEIDQTRLKHAATVANINDHIESLPMGYETVVGIEGMGLSSGQLQRLLIARAVYKNPDYLFFDEATSWLDANNEKIIMNNLNQFFKGKTVVVIAHRLSTVRNADQIIVLEEGKIIERGDHVGLTALRGNYFELVKNQLELGN